MLLRQFISASNAIEEIYIVKKETDSDDENPPVDKLLPETETVPPSMTIATDVGPTLPIEIKSEPEEDESDENLLKVLKTEEPKEPNDTHLPLVGSVEEKNPVVKTEDEDDVPLAVRLKKLKQTRAASRARKRKKLQKLQTEEQHSSDSEDSNDSFDADDVASDDYKRTRREPNCNVCSTQFTSRRELKNHLRKKHEDMLPFRCDKCASGEAKSICSLNRHFEMHDPDKPHKCNYCEGRFATKIHRTAHQRRFHKMDLENDTIRNANRRFVCRYCHKRFAAKFNLERHERNHEMKISDNEEFLNRRNKCYLCDSKPFDSKEVLYDHLSIHVDKLPYTCLKCDKPTGITSVRLLNKHLASHEEPEKPVKCVYCNERFISVVACQAHEKTHSQEKEADEKAVAEMEATRISTKIIIVDGMKRYECGYCGNSYSLLSTLRRHENIHTGRVQYVCKICGKIFNKSSCLLQHERTHSQDAPYKCEICNRGFKETIRLIEHRRIHSGERPFTCTNCFRSFRIKPLLKEHILQCSAPDVSVECKCRFCDSIFNCYRDLSDHIVNNHPLTIEETQCEFCDLRFKDSIQLTEHEHQHRNPYSIRCNVCGRIFKQVSNLRRHMRLHSNDAVPYQCDLCGKHFSQAGALKVHKRIHSGEKPYKCDLCDKSFYHSSTKNRHKRSHYKTQSKLFLFGEKSASQTDDVTITEETKPDVTIITISTIEECMQPESIAPDSMLNLDHPTIPTAVEGHILLSGTQQVPTSVHVQQQQQIQLSTFEIAGTSSPTTTTLNDGTSLYVLNTKLLIPQTIMEHQENTADCLSLEPSIGPNM